MTPNSKTLSTPHELFIEGIERCPPAKYLTNVNEINLYAAMSKQLTFSSGGIRMKGLTYASYEFADMAKELGTGFKVDVRWDADSVAQVYVKHPKTHKWIVATCTNERYAENLTWNQHLLIRLHAREKRKASGADEDLLATRSELHDYFESATRKPTRAESLAAARFAGYSSNNPNPKQFQKPEEDIVPPQISASVEGKGEEPAEDQVLNYQSETMLPQVNVDLFEEVEVFETVMLADKRNEVKQYAFGRKLH
jgi:putative transposase